jgi:metal-sulfur cluster biosynthetic enzyme
MSEANKQAPNPIKWSIHDTHPELVEAVRSRLGEVIDPEIGMSIIQLGLVRDVSIEDGIAHLGMVLTTPFCPYGPAMIEMTRQKAVEALEQPVTVEMLPDVWDFAMMEDPSALDWGMYT